MTAVGDAIGEEAKRIESDALYTAQTNFVQAVWFGRMRYVLALPAVVFSALAGTAVVAGWSDVSAGVAAVVATILGTADLFVGSERRSQEHHRQGVEYRALQHDARRLRKIDAIELDDSERRAALRKLVAEQKRLNEANRPNELAFRSAQKKIKRGDALHPGDENLQ